MPDPATPETLFRCCSISKMVSALGALRLVAESRIGLDDDVNDHENGIAAEGSREYPLRAAGRCPGESDRPLDRVHPLGIEGPGRRREVHCHLAALGKVDQILLPRIGQAEEGGG